MIAVVIGAGIVGLHVSRLLREKGFEVFVLERETRLAEHTSGRNSGVIHAGIFYGNDPFKEEVCIEGNRLTYEWLEKLDVPHQRCGKWIVPEEGQEEELEPFFERISRLPIPKPALLSAAETKKEEPLLRPSKAAFVPSTGIVDAAGYVKALARHVESKGVGIITNCHVTGIKENRLETSRGEINFDRAVNTAGLFCDDIAHMAGLEGYSIRPCRGDYFILSKSPLKRPVYHLPYKKADGLGVHLTPTFDGQMLAGPNAFFIDNKTDYRHRSDSSAFERAVRYFVPSLSSLPLAPAYSGNRPKLYYRDKPLPEFKMIKKENWIHLLGIESPGLTSAPALARKVRQAL